MADPVVIRRTHNGGPDMVVHTAGEPIEWPPLDTDPHDRIGHTATMPGRHWRERRGGPPNPWTVRLFGYSLLIVLVAAVGVLLW